MLTTRASITQGLRCVPTNYLYRAFKSKLIRPQVFHEGLKSWSCCKEINKPELDFDEFMKIEVGLVPLCVVRQQLNAQA